MLCIKNTIFSNFKFHVVKSSDFTDLVLQTSGRKSIKCNMVCICAYIYIYI